MQRLIETYILSSDHYEKVDRPLTESEQSLMVEGTPYKALAIYRFEFTRPGKKNLNGRIYPYALWDKVIAASPVTLALMDHPSEGAGNPKDVWAVVRNPQYSSNREVITADAYIIDNENGRSALGVLEAGGDLGLSSSGYGDFLSDGITVDPETFQLERYFDWVLQPSYEVYGHQSDKVSESTNTKTSDTGIKSVSEKKENHMKEFTLREKREFEISMKKIFEETASIANPKERMEKAKEAVSYYEEISNCDTMKAEFEKLAADAEKECDEAYEKAAKADEAIQRAEQAEFEKESAKIESDDKDKLIKELETKLEDQGKELEKKESSIKECKELINSFSKDAAQKVSYEDYSALHEYAENAVRLLKLKREEIDTLRAEKAKLSEALALSEKRLTALVEKQLAEEAAAKEHKEKVLEARKENERKIAEAKERELISGANPEVVSYYEDLVKRGENVASLREGILGKKTLFEAQSYFLRNKHRAVHDPENNLHTDLSEKITGGRGTQVTSNIKLPKGFI